MNPAPGERRPIYSLWVAAAIIAIGGLLPLVLGGTSSRISHVLLPFAIAAIGFAACGWLYTQGRATIAILYFVSGLAVIYGLLSMFAVPVSLVALGSCPVAPDPCTSGLPRALSEGESTGMASATAFGIVGLLVGFFGVVMHYRRTAVRPLTPPARNIPPVVTEPTVTKATAHASEPEPQAELPAPDELPELPAHESTASTT